MEILLLLLRLGLAGVLALAGFAKLADIEGSRKAFGGFGVPPSLSKVGPVLLSIVEIGFAGMLLFNETSWFGAVGGLALLVLFIGQMSYQLARGNAPDCHCFGQVYSAPVSAMSIARNVIFAIPALVLTIRGRSGQGAAITDPSVNTLELVLGGVIVVSIVAALTYLRNIAERQKEILKQLEVMELVARADGSVERADAGTPHDGLPIGAVAPQFELESLDGVTTSSDELIGIGAPVLLLFVSPTCTPCRSLIPEFEQWMDDLGDRVSLAFVSTGAAEDNREKFDEKISSRMFIQRKREVAELFRAQWTPSAVLVDAKGRIASHVIAGDGAIRQLIEEIENEDLTKPAVHFKSANGTSLSRSPVGEEIPDLHMTDIQGREITSEDLKGKSTLIAFWGTTCPHCSNMLEELRNWDKIKGQDEPNLLILSNGERDAVEALGFESPVVIDTDYKSAAQFGMAGTPSAVLIDENGIFVSETAIGAPDIWALIGKRK